MYSRPTHLCKLQSFSPTWIGTTNALGSGMGGLCRDPEGQYFVWSSSFPLTTQARLVSSSNPTVDVTINYIKLRALIMEILLFAPGMSPLTHIHTYVDNMTAQIWANRGSVSTASSVGPILQ